MKSLCPEGWSIIKSDFKKEKKLKRVTKGLHHFLKCQPSRHPPETKLYEDHLCSHFTVLDEWENRFTQVYSPPALPNDAPHHILMQSGHNHILVLTSCSGKGSFSELNFSYWQHS